MGLPSNLVSAEMHGDQRSVWWMLLSHHAPGDLGRTWSVFGVRVCVRCLALAMFAIAVLFFKSAVAAAFSPCGRWGVLLLTIPAWFDFSLGELWRTYPRTNLFRFLSGALFGCGLGCCLAFGLDAGDWLPLLGFAVVTALEELAVAFLFFFCGHLESYLEKYEDAVGLRTHSHSHGSDACPHDE